MEETSDRAVLNYWGCRTLPQLHAGGVGQQQQQLEYCSHTLVDKHRTSVYVMFVLSFSVCMYLKILLKLFFQDLFFGRKSFDEGNHAIQAILEEPRNKRQPYPTSGHELAAMMKIGTRVKRGS